MKIFGKNNVVKCYDIASLSLQVGVEDYTDGIYNGNSLTDYRAAQRNQHDYLLDELGVWKGFRLLDVGCGNGALLIRARERGVLSKGITISSNQVEYCVQRGLEVSLHDYRELPAGWEGAFDGIIVNGSLEHFCQVSDADKGFQDEIYLNMFKTFHYLLDRKSSSQKVVTTAIHFNGKPPNPTRLSSSPFWNLGDSKLFHFSILNKGYGGYYPSEDQLARCAKKYFGLERQVDGTEDYHYTSEDWKRIFLKGLFSNTAFAKRLAAKFFKSPVQTINFAMSFIGPEAWPWQFRGETPPTRLYRHTWVKKKVDNK